MTEFATDRQALVIVLCRRSEISGNIGRQAKQVECPGDEPPVAEPSRDSQTLPGELPSDRSIVFEVRNTAERMQHPRLPPQILQLHGDAQAPFELHACRR